jgi:hypothetical protein
MCRIIQVLCRRIIAVAHTYVSILAISIDEANGLRLMMLERDFSLSGKLTTPDELRWLILALAKIGRNDVAYRLIHNDTFPSWRLTPSNTALRASGSVGTAGRPKPASAQLGRGRRRQDGN